MRKRLGPINGQPGVLGADYCETRIMLQTDNAMDSTCCGNSAHSKIIGHDWTRLLTAELARFLHTCILSKYSRVVSQIEWQW